MVGSFVFRAGPPAPILPTESKASNSLVRHTFVPSPEHLLARIGSDSSSGSESSKDERLEAKVELLTREVAKIKQDFAELRQQAQVLADENKNLQTTTVLHETGLIALSWNGHGEIRSHLQVMEARVKKKLLETEATARRMMGRQLEIEVKRDAWWEQYGQRQSKSPPRHPFPSTLPERSMTSPSRIPVPQRLLKPVLRKASSESNGKQKSRSVDFDKDIDFWEYNTKNSVEQNAIQLHRSRREQAGKASESVAT